MRPSTLMIWSFRDLTLRPLESLLLFSALFLATLSVSTPLLLAEGVRRTASRIVSQGPAVVVGCVEAGGWTPVAIAEGIRAAGSVTGVTAVRPRLWGTVRTAAGPVVVMGVGAEDGAEGAGSFRLPGPGEAVIGGGVAAGGLELTLTGPDGKEVPFRISGRLPEDTAMAANDLALLHPVDARRILGIPEGFATDLALEVFRDEEIEAVLPDLFSAFPWQVRISTRTEAARGYAAGTSRRAGLALMAALPGWMAVVLIAFGVARERVGGQRQTGLLKACGWTAADIVRFQAYRAAFVAIPALASASAAAYGLVFFPGVTWPGRLLLGWERPPFLHLDPSGSPAVLASVAAVVSAPFLAAVLWPSIRGAAVDPGVLMEQEGSFP